MEKRGFHVTRICEQMRYLFLRIFREGIFFFSLNFPSPHSILALKFTEAVGGCINFCRIWIRILIFSWFRTRSCVRLSSVRLRILRDISSIGHVFLEIYIFVEKLSKFIIFFSIITSNLFRIHNTGRGDGWQTL